MTDARSLRRRREQQATKDARRGCRAQGCTCEVALEIVSWEEGMPQVAARHDDWCPLLRVMQERDPSARHQVVLSLRKDEGP